MTASPSPHAAAKALRDFFSARSGEDFRSASAELRRIAPRFGVEGPGREDPEETEWAFNRLFVGPGPLVAPPYASVYLDAAGQLMGPASRRAARFYAEIGLRSPAAGSTPDDHLAFELDAAVVCGGRGRGPEASVRAARWAAFLDDHVRLWVPPFLRRIDDAGDLPATIRSARALLEVWLARELGRIAPAPST